MIVFQPALTNSRSAPCLWLFHADLVLDARAGEENMQELTRVKAAPRRAP
jgi:hypothetical protein